MSYTAEIQSRDFPVAELSSPPIAHRSGQRVVDIVASLLLLILLTPLLLLVFFAVWLQDGGPVIYGQKRIGFRGQEFRCFKIRSMVLNSDAVLAELLATSPSARMEWARDHKLKNDPRITPLGRLLRSSSMDELPQLWNVLVGEMSLVGPRPIVSAEVTRYGMRFSYYCACRPGITGLWQVSGRNDVSYRRRVALDSIYARRCSLMLDGIILARTFPAVLGRRGSY